MTVADVGTARRAVTGGKPMEVRAGPDRLEDDLEGINGIHMITWNAMDIFFNCLLEKYNITNLFNINHVLL